MTLENMLKNTAEWQRANDQPEAASATEAQLMAMRQQWVKLLHREMETLDV